MLAGCASTLQKLQGPKLDYREYTGEPVKSFYMNNFDGWTPVSKDEVVVWSGINKAYLLKLTGYCPDLQFANAIAVTSTANTVDKFEKVIVGRDRCFIQEIRPVDVKQMKEDRKLIRDQRRRLPESLMAPRHEVTASRPGRRSRFRSRSTSGAAIDQQAHQPAGPNQRTDHRDPGHVDGDVEHARDQEDPRAGQRQPPPAPRSCSSAPAPGTRAMLPACWRARVPRAPPTTV